jgi:phage terminase large subunit-like protein
VDPAHRVRRAVALVRVHEKELEAEVEQVGDGLSEMREKDMQKIYLITTKLSVVSKMRDKHRCDE